MSPNDDLRQPMAELADEQPPMRGSVADDLRFGRRRLRIKRGVAALGTSAFAGVALVGAFQVLGGIPDRDPDPAPPAVGDAPILRKCAQLGDGALDPDSSGPAPRC